MASTSSQQKLAMSRDAWLLLILLAVLWGCSFLFNELALLGVSPPTLAFCRVSLGAIFLLLYCLVTGRHKFRISWKQWGGYILLGVFACTLPFNLYAFAQTHITSGLASIYNALTPLATIVVAHFATSDEKMNWRKAFAFAVGIVGVIVLLGVDLGDATGGGALYGHFLAVLPPFCYAIAIVMTRKLNRWQVGVVRGATLQVLCGALSAAVLALIIGDPISELATLSSHPEAGKVVLGLIGLGLGSTAVAYVVYFRIVEIAGAVNLSMVTYLIPIVAVSVGVIFLDEVFTLQQLIGGGIILGAVLISDRRFLGIIKSVVFKKTG